MKPGTVLSGSIAKKISWFDKMEGSLQWKFIPPELSNPYKPAISDQTLQEWFDNPSALRKASAIKVICDGFEILYMKNLIAPMICSDHPCISGLPQSEILDYIARSSVHGKIEEDLLKIRAEIEEELKKRRAIQKSRAVLMPQKKEKKPKNHQQPGYGSTIRVIRG